MNTFYAIIYAFIRPNIEEKLSIGLFCISNDVIYLKMDTQKIAMAKELIPNDTLVLALENELQSIIKTVSAEKINDNIFNERYFNYLHSYKNNIIGFSTTDKIDIEINETIFDKLYRKYISENDSAITFIRDRKKSAINLCSSNNS